MMVGDFTSSDHGLGLHLMLTGLHESTHLRLLLNSVGPNHSENSARPSPAAARGRFTARTARRGLLEEDCRHVTRLSSTFPRVSYDGLLLCCVTCGLEVCRTSKLERKEHASSTWQDNQQGTLKDFPGKLVLSPSKSPSYPRISVRQNDRLHRHCGARI